MEFPEILHEEKYLKPLFSQEILAKMSLENYAIKSKVHSKNGEFQAEFHRGSEKKFSQNSQNVQSFVLSGFHDGGGGDFYHIFHLIFLSLIEGLGKSTDVPLSI